MNNNTIFYKIAYMALIAYLVGIFKEPGYLALLIFLPFVGRRKQPRKEIQGQLDDINEQLRKAIDNKKETE